MALLNSSQLFKVGGLIYLVSALGFLAQLFGEITGYYLLSGSWLVHELVSLATLLGFTTGALLIWLSHRQLQRRNQEIERLLRSAQGEFFAMLCMQFERWGLSTAEKDIAMLTIKGLSVAEIAEMRSTTQGTVKSQNSSIYRKAAVKTRTQLLGVLIEELLPEN